MANLSFKFSLRELAKVHLIFPSWTKLRTSLIREKRGKETAAHRDLLWDELCLMKA